MNQCIASEKANVRARTVRIRPPLQNRAGPVSFDGRSTGLVAWGAVGASSAAPRVGSPWSG